MVNSKELPPHDIDAEECVIGSILIMDETIRDVENILKPLDFYYERTRFAYEGCLSLRARHEAIDEITLAQELNHKGKLETVGGAGYMPHLVSITPTPYDIKSYAEIVRRLSIGRQMIVLGSNIADMGYNIKPDINESISSLSSKVAEFNSKVAIFDELISPQDAGNVLFDMIQKYQNPPKGMSWGFRDLDNITSGIFPELIIIGGRPSTGKTQLMLDIMESVCLQGYKSLFCSAEMMIESLIERKIARDIKIDIKKLRHCGLDPEIIGKLIDLVGQISEQQVYRLPKGVSSQDIYNEVGKMKSTIGVDIVFVDYLQILRDCWQLGRENKNVLVGRASKILKSIVDNFKIPVLCTSQLNREVEHRASDERRPNLADLKESGEIEQDADVVMLLYRDMDNPDKNISNVLEVKMAKHRQLGDAQAIKLVWVDKEHKYFDCQQKAY